MTMIMIMIMKTNTYVTDCITQNKVSTLNIYLVRPAGYIASLLALATNEVYLLGRDSHMKGAGCSLSLLGLHVKRCIKIIYFTRFMQFRFATVSFRVKTKGWATLRLTFRQLKGFHSNFRRASPPISYGVPSRVHCTTTQTLFSVNSSSC